MKPTTTAAIGAGAVITYFLYKDGKLKSLGALGAGAQPGQTGLGLAQRKPLNPTGFQQPGVPIVTGASGTLQDIKSGVGIGADLTKIAQAFGFLGSGDDETTSGYNIPTTDLGAGGAFNP